MTIEQSLSLSEIVRGTRELSNLFGETIKKISGASTEKDILKIGVEIIYQTLRCNRAVVYSLEQESFCKIVAEAVTPGYSQTLGLVIQDPCFEARYIDRYQKGRVKATDNIYQSDMSPCHIENLEKIDVKANLVVPLICKDNSLYGLLVMHQCSQPRQWKQSEINFMLQIADWIMGEIFRLQKFQQLQTQLEDRQKCSDSIAEATNKIHAGSDFSEVLQTTVDIAQEYLQCDRVVVYGLEDGDLGTIISESTIPALAPILGRVIVDPCFEYRYREKYQNGRARAIDNIYEAGMTSCYIESLEKIAVKSNLVVPINWDDGEIYGLLVAHQCFTFKKWQSNEIEWLKQIGIQTGLSLSKARLKQQIASMQLGFAALENVRDAIATAKLKIKKIQQPIQNTSQALMEINNLNKLLNREFDSINQSASAQTRKETKLIQIILKKLFLNTNRLKQSFNLFNNNQETIEKLLEDAAINLYNSEPNIHSTAITTITTKKNNY